MSIHQGGVRRRGCVNRGSRMRPFGILTEKPGREMKRRITLSLAPGCIKREAGEGGASPQRPINHPSPARSRSLGQIPSRASDRPLHFMSAPASRRRLKIGQHETLLVESGASSSRMSLLESLMVLLAGRPAGQSVARGLRLLCFGLLGRHALMWVGSF